MKIGDKVRFLSEVGGGTVSGFQGKNIVLVQDEDGFDIPMLRTQVVVIDTDDYNIAKVDTLGLHSKQKGHTASPAKPQATLIAEDEEVEPCDKPITFRHRDIERKDGDRLNLYLSFLPLDVKMLASTSFETYLVNDSNYYLQVLYMSAEGAAWRTRFCAQIEPNSKVFVEEIDRNQIGDLSRVCVQLIAWKQDKTFQLKPAVATELRVDGVKFYKLHLFQPNDFFADPNLTLDVVRDDRPVRQVFADASQLQEALMTKKAEDEKSDAPKSKPAKPKAATPIEVDLHASELIDTTAGMSGGDILMLQMNEFRRVMDENRKQLGRQIVFIHGKGDGVLRKNILQELKYRYKGCIWQDASFREYGFGATMVKIGKEPSR